MGVGGIFAARHPQKAFSVRFCGFAYLSKTVLVFIRDYFYNKQKVTGRLQKNKGERV